MSSCDDFRAQLPLFVGGDLEAPLAARLEEHLGRPQAPHISSSDPARPSRIEGCAACAQALEELRSARSHLLELPRLSPAPLVDLWRPIRTRLAAEGRIASGPSQVAPQPPPRFARRRPVLARLVSAAAAVALIALGARVLVQRPAEVAPADPGRDGERIAEQVDPQALPTGESLALPGLLVQPAGTGGLRRLGPDELPFSTDPHLRDALRAQELMGWPGWQFGPGLQGQAVDPSHPTLASDLR